MQVVVAGAQQHFITYLEVRTSRIRRPPPAADPTDHGGASCRGRAAGSRSRQLNLCRRLPAGRAAAAAAAAGADAANAAINASAGAVVPRQRRLCSRRLCSGSRPRRRRLPAHCLLRRPQLCSDALLAPQHFEACQVFGRDTVLCQVSLRGANQPAGRAADVCAGGIAQRQVVAALQG